MSISLNSAIPIGGGLGSSSALCVALAGAFYYMSNNKIDKNKICLQAINAERLINQQTSGADCNICTFGGIGIYDKSMGFKRYDVDISNAILLIIDSGQIHDTSEMVKKVHKFKQNYGEFFQNICKEYEQIYKLAVRALKYKDIEFLGLLMNKNHELLSKFKLSTRTIDKIVSICNSAGSLGTKITGAGGGGSILSLMDKDASNSLNIVIEKLNSLKVNHSVVKIDHTGLRVEV